MIEVIDQSVQIQLKCEEPATNSLCFKTNGGELYGMKI